MLKFNQFIFEKYTDNLSEEQINIMNKIISYLEENTNFDFYKYSEEFIIKKRNSPTLTGNLYLMNDDKALRFNFEGEELHSIDLWKLFSFDTKTITNQPYYTILLHTTNVDDNLDDIVDFVSEDIELYEDVYGPDVKISETETVKFKSIKISKTVLDKDLDVFEAINYYVRQVAYGVSNSLIISGDAGVGKSSEVTEILDESRMDYKFFKGDISTAGLYETLFVHNGKLLVFDDSDPVFQDDNSVKLLLSALDTKPEREISRILKTNYDSEGMSYQTMLKTFKENGKLPKQFSYTGRCIFITNVDGKKMDKALVSRSLHVDVKLTREQIIERLKKITDKIYKTIPKEKVVETIEFVDYMTTNFESKFPLSIRTVIHALNIRISNEFMVDIDGEKVPAWQMLIKQYLIKKN